jgi:cation transport ATPase
VAAEVGIDEVIADVLPGDKAEVCAVFRARAGWWPWWATV